MVIGGGLLGLEAAKALLSLGLETHVIEFASRLMPLQVDEVGAGVVRARIEELGVKVRCSTTTREILLDENGHVNALLLGDGTQLPVDMVVFSAGIRPRDKLARESGLRLGERGGMVIDGSCRTSDERIFAVGECAAFDGKTYGLVAPGYRMAEVAAGTIAGEALAFDGFDMSTKLKLLVVDVGSFGDAFGATPGSRVFTVFDGHSSVYKKLVLSEDKTQLLGGVLVGDASAYSQLLIHVQAGMKLPEHPEDLLFPPR